MEDNKLADIFIYMRAAIFFFILLTEINFSLKYLKSKFRINQKFSRGRAIIQIFENQ